MVVIAFTLIFIFLALAVIHFNWFFGGQFGFKAAIPTAENGEPVLHPRPIDSAIVGLGLLLFATFYCFKSDVLSFQIYDWIYTFGSWIIPLIFLLRAIGDFKYVGFFKKIKSTQFAKNDTRLFSPLCLTIAILGLILNFN